MTATTATITIIRDSFSTISTQGRLLFNGEYVCETLEDTCRDKNHDGDLDDAGEGKVYGQTAIPSGIYKMTIIDSPHFKRKLFLLHGVKGYSAVEIHAGNWVSDSLGCILVGMERGKDMINVGTSKKALDKLMDKAKEFKEFKLIIIDKVSLN